MMTFIHNHVAVVRDEIFDCPLIFQSLQQIDLASDLDLMLFAFDDGSSCSVPLESSRFPRIHHWHLRIRKVADVSRNNC